MATLSKLSGGHRGKPRCMGAGDLVLLVTDFRRRLTDKGHTDLTVRGYDDAARHFAHWVAQSQIAIADIGDAVVGRFARHRCRCPGARRAKHVSNKYTRRVARFVAFLGERGIGQNVTKPEVPAPDLRVVEFQDWLRSHRGLRQKTLDLHGYMLRRQGIDP